MALMMSLPVRIPESNKIVNFPEDWAALIIGDFMIISNASNAEIAPSTCRPPDIKDKRRKSVTGLSLDGNNSLP